MIEFDIKDERLILIYESNLLKGYITNQLKVIGFEYFEDHMRLADSFNILSVLLETTRYFNIENQKYSTTTEVETLLSDYYSKQQNLRLLVKRGGEFKNGKFDRSDFKKHIEFLETHLVRTLRDHQIKSSFHLYTVKNGANFSVPGSGKTSVVLACYERYRVTGEVNKIFVVGPPSSFDPWVDEFVKTLGRKPEECIIPSYVKSERISIYEGTACKDSELFLTTYNTVHADTDLIRNFISRDGNKFMLVIDEAHYIKKIGGQWSSAVLGISPNSVVRVVLTGTPTPRDYSDLINMFDFLYPDGDVLSEENRSKIIFFSEKQEHGKVKTIIDKALTPLYYRVRKKDLGLKPQVFLPPIEVEMNKVERAIYDFLTNRIKMLSHEDALMKDPEFFFRVIRSRVIRTRQVLSYPKLLKTMIAGYDEQLINDSDLWSMVNNYDELEVPQKIIKLKSLISDLVNRGQKTIVWSNFIDTIKLIYMHLSSINITSEMIYGDIPYKSRESNENLLDIKTRSSIINEFKDPDSQLMVLIANPGACSESISLHTICQDAIYYDLSYNCSQYVQSQDRIHRVGGSEEKESRYYFLQYSNTIEWKIKNNLDGKKKRMEELLDVEFPIYHDNTIFENDIETEYLFVKDA